MRRDPLRRDDDFDREFNSMARMAKGWLVFVALMSVIVLAVVVWAIVRLVERFT